MFAVEPSTKQVVPDLADDQWTMTRHSASCVAQAYVLIESTSIGMKPCMITKYSLAVSACLECLLALAGELSCSSGMLGHINIMCYGKGMLAY